MQFTNFEIDELLNTIKRNNRELAETYLNQVKLITMIEQRDLLVDKCITVIQNLQAQLTDDYQQLPSREDIKKAIMENREIPR